MQKRWSFHNPERLSGGAKEEGDGNKAEPANGTANTISLFPHETFHLWLASAEEGMTMGFAASTEQAIDCRPKKY